MNALISVSDKTGVAEFAAALVALGFNLLSTGGTAKLLQEAGLPVTEVAEVTQFPEMLDGRVKTLHPKVHGGLLARRDVPAHMVALAEHGIGTIDMLVVNLYPFEATVAKPGCTLADAIERSEGQDAARLKGEKRSGMRVHARTGLPCPVCGDVVREVSFAERSFQYCATCQTGGKPLADRRMSKLLK